MTGKELYNILTEEIRSGRISGMLPSISQMKARYKTSHNTIHLALDRLKMQGIVYGKQGKGVFVNREGLQKNSRGSVLFYLGALDINSFIRNRFYARMLIVLKAELQKAGLELVLNSRLDDLPKRYSAVIVPDANRLEQQDLSRLNLSLPGRICLLNHKVDGYVSISNDNFRGGWLAAERLYAAGHRNLAMVTIYLDLPYSFFHDRRDGALAFQRKHRDLCITQFPVFSQEDRESVSEIAQEILAHHPEITGVFTFKEIYAYEMYRVFHQAGREISLIGYGNPDYAEFMIPQLTTIAEDPDALGQAVARTVCCQIAGKAVKSADVPVQLIERQTVYPVKVRGRFRIR